MIEVRPFSDEDSEWMLEVQAGSWGMLAVARLGELVDVTDLPGFVAYLDGERAGLLSYAIRDDECEVVTIRSLQEGRGVARALMDAVRDAAREAGCRRLWLITTNNNLRALELYQRWGMDIVAFHRNGIAKARHLKPSIPERDARGIPIAHEFELELLL